MSWRGVVGFFAGFCLAFWVGLVSAHAATGPFAWVQTSGGSYVVYDSGTGALFNGGDSAPSFSEVQTIFANGNMTASGESWLGNMPVLDFATPSAGELALSGVEVGATFASDGLIPLAGEVVGDLWGLNNIRQFLQDLANASACTNSATCSRSGTGSVSYCFQGESDLYNFYTSQGVEFGSMCEGTDSLGQTYTAPRCGTYACPADLNPIATTATQAQGQIQTDLVPSNSNYDTLVNDLQNIFANYPASAPVPSVAPGTVTDTYTGPSSVTGTPYQSTTGGQTSTVTPSMSPTYSPQGVTPGPVTLNSCTGTGACTSTTVTPSATTKTATPFVAPTGALPRNPTLTPTATALTLNVTPVQGSCPPPVLLNLTAEDMGSYSISLAPICTLAGYVSPVVVASAAVAAGFIILQ